MSLSDTTMSTQSTHLPFGRECRCHQSQLWILYPLAFAFFSAFLCAIHIKAPRILNSSLSLCFPFLMRARAFPSRIASAVTSGGWQAPIRRGPLSCAWVCRCGPSLGCRCRRCWACFPPRGASWRAGTSPDPRVDG